MGFTALGLGLGILGLVTRFWAKVKLGTGIWAKFRFGTGIWGPPFPLTTLFVVIFLRKI